MQRTLQNKTKKRNKNKILQSDGSTSIDMWKWNLGTMEIRQLTHTVCWDEIFKDKGCTPNKKWRNKGWVEYILSELQNLIKMGTKGWKNERW